MRIIRCISSLIIAIALIAVYAVNTEAGILVTPERHIVELSKGESKAVRYEVYNSGPEDLEVDIDPQNWGGHKMNINSWVTLKENRLDIKVNERKPLDILAKAPLDGEGECVAMIFLCYKEEKDSILNIRNGIPLYIVVKGTERYGLNIQDINAECETRPDEYLVVIRLKVENSGNIHIKPDIKISLKDAKGEEVESFVSGKADAILRGQQNEYRFNWLNPILPEGEYIIDAKVGYEDKVKTIKKTARFSIKDGKIIMQKEGSSK